MWIKSHWRYASLKGTTLAYIYRCCVLVNSTRAAVEPLHPWGYTQALLTSHPALDLPLRTLFHCTYVHLHLTILTIHFSNYFKIQMFTSIRSSKNKCHITASMQKFSRCLRSYNARMGASLLIYRLTNQIGGWAWVTSDQTLSKNRKYLEKGLISKFRMQIRTL